jgi:iron complex outermembrane receptor protein
MRSRHRSTLKSRGRLGSDARRDQGRKRDGQHREALHQCGLSIGRSAYDNYLTNFEASAEGPLARLPGGEASLAIGGGYRRFRLDFNVRSTAGGVTTGTRDAQRAPRKPFGYGELSLPLVGVRQSHAVARDAAAERRGPIRALHRHRRGRDPKLGLVYAPHRDITFKYSWGRSFKIPTLQQVNQPREAILLRNQLFAQPTPALPGRRDRASLSGAQPRPSRRAGDELDASRSRSSLLDGLRIEASYFDIDYRGRIANAIRDYTTAFINPVAAELRALQSEHEPPAGTDRARGTGAVEPERPSL